MNKQKDNRLNIIRKLLEKKEEQGHRLCWIRWNPNSKHGYNIEDAREDIQWMVYEIQRLQDENTELKSFVETFRNNLEKDLNT